MNNKTKTFSQFLNEKSSIKKENVHQKLKDVLIKTNIYEDIDYIEQSESFFNIHLKSSMLVLNPVPDIKELMNYNKNSYINFTGIVIELQPQPHFSIHFLVQHRTLDRM